MSSGVSQSRSIGDIIESLKTRFRGTDYSAAVSDLTAREEGLRRENREVLARLREKCDSLEAECAGLKTRELMLEEKCRRLSRECDVNNDKLNDLARELSLTKEKEEKGRERYDRLFKEVREMEEDKENLIKEKADLGDKLEEQKGIVTEKEVMIEDREAQINANLVELEELRKTNAQLEEVNREKDERIEELSNKVKAVKKLLEVELKALKDQLEEKKAKFDAQEEEHRRNNLEKDEQIRKLEKEKNEVVKEKDVKIQDLLKDKESLNLEKRQLTEELGQVEKRFSKLEEDVVNCMCLDLERNKRFASARIGKIISGIIQAFDSEEIGNTCSAGVEKDSNAQEANSTSNSRVNESNCCLKSDKQSTQEIKKTVDVKLESQSEEGAFGSNTIIVIDDSDDEDENPVIARGANNKRKRLGTMNDQHNNDGSNDDSLNPKHKIKKLEQKHCDVKQESSPAALSAAKDDYKFSSQRQTLETIKRCVEKLGREVSGSSSLPGDNDRKGDDSKYKDGTPKADGLWSPQTEKYLTNRRQRKQNNRIECVADMICALDQDNDFCAKAVCALYRLQKSSSSGKIGSDIGGSTRIEEPDWERVKTLAEFLIDGDPNGKLKKSVFELQGHDPKGLVDCKHFAKKYKKTLIDIFKKKGDPLFLFLFN